jgi:bacterioferritin-associated ferredoxin
VIICHCGVGDRDVAECIANGARTISKVAKCTGAGQGCGACVLSLRRLLCEHEAIRQSPEVESATR